MPEYYNNHYILLDSSDNIIDGWSDGPLPDKDTSQAICINSKGGYQFRLFSDGEENPSLCDFDGTHLYKYENGTIMKKSDVERRIEKSIILNKQIDSIKQLVIQQTKLDLDIYLANHPLVWRDRKSYSVTQEKQALLTEQLSLYSLDNQMPLYWNAAGDECSVWSIQDLASLAKDIATYVRPYVRYQQQKEKEIMAAETVDDVYDIKVDYSTI